VTGFRSFKNCTGERVLNQLEAGDLRPNQDDRRLSKMLSSMASKAAERSRRHRHDNCCDCDKWPKGRVALITEKKKQNTFGTLRRNPGAISPISLV